MLGASAPRRDRATCPPHHGAGPFLLAVIGATEKPLSRDEDTGNAAQQRSGRKL
jgi:hypothetical protein